VALAQVKARAKVQLHATTTAANLAQVASHAAPAARNAHRATTRAAVHAVTTTAVVAVARRVMMLRARNLQSAARVSRRTSQ